MTGAPGNTRTSMPPTCVMCKNPSTMLETISPIASMWVAIKTEGRESFAPPSPRLNPCTEPSRLRVTSSASGVHLAEIRSATGDSNPDKPATEMIDFRKGRISLMGFPTKRHKCRGTSLSAKRSWRWRRRRGCVGRRGRIRRRGGESRRRRNGWRHRKRIRRCKSWRGAWRECECGHVCAWLKRRGRKSGRHRCGGRFGDGDDGRDCPRDNQRSHAQRWGKDCACRGDRRRFSCDHRIGRKR